MVMNIFYYTCGEKFFLINIVIFVDFSVIPVISCVISVKTVISVNTVISVFLVNSDQGYGIRFPPE